MTRTNGQLASQREQSHHRPSQSPASMQAAGVDYLVAILSSSNSSIAKTFAPGLSAHA